VPRHLTEHFLLEQGPKLPNPVLYVSEGSRSEDPWTSHDIMNRFLLVAWRKHWNRSLLLFLKQRVRARVDIDDLAQETYLRLLRARDLSDVHNPKAYLLRIAGHVVSEWHDQQSRQAASIELDENIFVDDRTPEFELSAAISHERVNEVLTSCSAMMRAVLLLRLRDERAYRDIARELGITDRQVKRYLKRGYASLRQAVED
jgi:RNA polymerase sigma-70 factor (ECF subfamily)